jgi:hypothetical protein
MNRIEHACACISGIFTHISKVIKNALLASLKHSLCHFRVLQHDKRETDIKPPPFTLHLQSKHH